MDTQLITRALDRRNGWMMPEQSPDSMDPDVVAFYEHASEETRLQHGPFQLEELRTRELIERHAPEPPATVLDVGGAAGAYSFWLAERGYDVHLLDVTPRLIEHAKRRDERALHRLSSCRVGDARSLPFPAESALLVLLLGPLYHLVDASDRHRAILEAARVLRPGGTIIAAAISRWASALDGLSRELLTDPAFMAIVEQDVGTGQHRNPTGRRDYFTTAYFHQPEELRKEFENAGLATEAIYGIEGPGWILPDFADRWSDEHRRKALLLVARLMEREPSTLGCSAHLLAVVRKPGTLRAAV